MKVAVMYGGKNSKSKLLISDADVTELKSLSLADKFNNNWEISFQIPDNSVGKTFKLNLFDQTSGAGQNIFVEVFSRKQYSAIKNASSELSKPKKEWNALILGDSLSDLFRGQNYTDWLRYWMPEISWHNYGVRGDYITRIVDRLKGKRVWGFRRYKNVFAHVPDVVIIFCGHNDSRLTKSSGFKKTKVSIVNFKKDLLFLVRFLKAKKTKMKIILLAPAASNFYKSEKSWNAKGKSSDLFGSPDVLRQFRDAVKEAADEENCGFIDIYKFTKEYADNQKLFQPDGVHLSETGNYFVALKIIQYFASYGYWENIDRNSRKIKKQKDNFKN